MRRRSLVRSLAPAGFPGSRARAPRRRRALRPTRARGTRDLGRQRTPPQPAYNAPHAHNAGRLCAIKCANVSSGGGRAGGERGVDDPLPLHRLVSTVRTRPGHPPPSRVEGSGRGGEGRREGRRDPLPLHRLSADPQARPPPPPPLPSPRAWPRKAEDEMSRDWPRSAEIGLGGSPCASSAGRRSSSSLAARPLSACARRRAGRGS